MANRASRFSAVLGLLLVAGVLTPSAALAVSGSVVINELMYHAGSDLDDDDFLELHNPGDDPFDLSGMCFEGITLCFDPGTTLAGGGYVIVSRSIAQSQATYGVTPIAVYTSNLSNGGELIRLLDGTTVVDEVEYIDGAPWPVSPDGGGPSLELIDPASNNNVASSWAASTENLGTPGAVNSVFGTDPPEQIDNVTITPAAPSAADPVVVTAEMAVGLTAELTYKAMFESDVTVSMADDGLSGDGAVDDGVYGATIPAQSDGKLVRYRIDVTAGGDGAHPSLDDSIGYVGYVVSDPGVVTSLPVLQWFIPPADYSDMIANHRFDDTEVPGVLAHDGVVYDGVTFRIRGGSRSRSQPKPNFKIEMPSGHDFVAPGFLLGPVDEFVIQSEYKDITKGRAHTGWVAFDEAGFPLLEQFFVRMEQNRDFYGIYRFQQTYDGTWRDREGFDTGSLYKADGASWESPATRFDKKTPDDGDNAEIVQLAAVLDNSPSSAKTRYLLDNVDVPNMINYMATASLLRHFDHHGQNNYVYRTEDGRWGMLPWDLDQVWPQSDVRCGSDPFLTPACVTNLFEDAMLEVPEFRTMHFRRLRTLIDGLLTSGLIEDEYTQLLADIALDDPLEAARWSRPTAASRAYQLRNDIAARKAIFADAIADGTIPPAQAAVPSVVINELHYNPADGGVEFLELYNGGSASVDMSGWSVPGASLLIPPGTVILPGAYVVFTEDDVAFKALYGSGHFVAGEYGGGLSGGGELVELLDADGTVIDSVEYDDRDPWPETPDGDGPSLELFDPLIDNSVPNAWFPSAAYGGSPGEVNDPNTTGLPPPPSPPADVQYVDFGDVWKYRDNGSNQGTAWRTPGFNDSGWSSGPAELGYGDGGEATVVASGAPDRYITTYFRSSFVVGNPALVLDMRGGLIRDDGAIVYVNGTEVFRTNMPGGSVNYTTRASAGVVGAAESMPVAFTVPVGLLNSGANTVAVEIHQRGPGSSDISFDLELVGKTVQDTDTEDPTSPDPVTLTATGTSTMRVSWATSTDDSGTVVYDVLRTGAGVVATTSSTTFNDSGLTPDTEYEYVVVARDPSGNTTASTPVSEFTDADTTPPTDPGNLAATATGSTTIRVSWSASVDEGPVTYEVRQDGVFLANTSALSYTATDLDPETEYGFEVRAEDGAGNLSAPVGPVFETTLAETFDPVLIPAGSSWSYLDNGSDQGTAWRGSGFNDSSWDTGQAELGYGDGGETTVVNGGPVGNRFITTYFRRDFTVGDPGAFSELELRLKRDDGAVVYINGTEVLRSNMPGGTIGYTTRAATGVAGGAEGAFNTFRVPASVLVSGGNVIAVEVHQRSPQSSDISFDLSLEGIP
jgi:chitodextrinase